MESKNLVGRKVRIVAISNSALLLEDEENNKRYVVYSYCACNSGYWFLNNSEINDENYKKFSTEIEELYQSLSLKQ